MSDDGERQVQMRARGAFARHVAASARSARLTVAVWLEKTLARALRARPWEKSDDEDEDEDGRPR